jgi:hypothetical protein
MTSPTPRIPKHIRDFGLVGQEPGATGTVPTEEHGAISTGPQGNRVYVGYGTNKGGVLQILDRDKLDQRREGADARQPARAGRRRIADVAAGRRAHGLPARRGRNSRSLPATSSAPSATC